ncbi:MAG: hypothetical protein AB9891_05940 [Anaerolineaceae bacterium]
MNLLDKYMEQVGKRLPRKNRLDLQAEIRSTIEDMLEDRSRQTGRPVDDALVGEVLVEYGSPDKVAAGYKPARYLIGPRLYPFFLMVVRIVFIVLISLAVVGALISFYSAGQTAEAFKTALNEYGLGLLTGLISAFGNIVIVFAIIERVKPDTKFDEEDEKWTPADLEAEGDPDCTGRGELIFEILITVLGLAIFNLYPQIIGIGAFKEGEWVFIPALSQTFFSYLPWINLLAGLQILLALYLLRQGLWNTATRLISLAVEVGGIVLAGFMLVGPSLVNLEPAEITAIFGSAAATMTPFFNFIPQLVLIILIIVQTIEALQAVWKLIKQRNMGKTYLPR